MGQNFLWHDYLKFDPKMCNLFFNGSFRFVQLNSACPEVSKYCNNSALGIVVSEKIFEVQPNFTRFIPPYGALWGPSPPICTTFEALVQRVMHTKFGQNWPSSFRGDVEIWWMTTTDKVGLVNLMWPKKDKMRQQFNQLLNLKHVVHWTKEL